MGKRELSVAIGGHTQVGVNISGDDSLNEVVMKDLFD